MDYYKMYKEKYGELDYSKMSAEDLKKKIDEIEKDFKVLQKNLDAVNRNRSRPSTWGDIGYLGDQKDLIYKAESYLEEQKRDIERELEKK